jgi:hypothetical protein
LEDAPVGSPVFARDKARDGLEHLRQHVHPSGITILGHASRDAPPAARFVDVAPGEPLELAQPHPGRVEDDHGKPVALRENAKDSEELVDGRRLDLRLLLARQFHGSFVARRFRLDLREVEHHGERHYRLADRLALPRLRQLRNQVGDVAGRDRVDGAAAESGECAADVGSVLCSRVLRDVDARLEPPRRDVFQRRCLLRLLNR